MSIGVSQFAALAVGDAFVIGGIAVAILAVLVACQQEMKAKVTQSRASLVLAEADIPAALAWAFRAGQLHARRLPVTQKRRLRSPQLVASTPDRISDPRQPRVDRVQAVNPIRKKPDPQSEGRRRMNTIYLTRRFSSRGKSNV